MTAWSFSSLGAFETCPRRYYKTKVTKEVREEQTEATIHGNAVHKAFELHLKGSQALPAKYEAYRPIVDRVAKAPGKRLIEWKWALNSAFKPTEYFAKDVWCRGVIDFGVLSPKTAVVLDWKTGKRKVDSDQLKLFAAATFAHFPYLERVDTGFVWLPDQKLDTQVFVPSDTPPIWGDFLHRAKRIEIAESKTDFPPRPSGLCKKHCPVPRAQCEFSGKE